MKRLTKADLARSLHVAGRTPEEIAAALKTSVDAVRETLGLHKDNKRTDTELLDWLESTLGDNRRWLVTKGPLFNAGRFGVNIAQIHYGDSGHKTLREAIEDAMGEGDGK